MKYLVMFLLFVLVSLAACNPISDAEEVFEEVEAPAFNSEDEEDPSERTNGG